MDCSFAFEGFNMGRWNNSEFMVCLNCNILLCCESFLNIVIDRSAVALAALELSPVIASYDVQAYHPGIL